MLEDYVTLNQLENMQEENNVVNILKNVMEKFVISRENTVDLLEQLIQDHHQAVVNGKELKVMKEEEDVVIGQIIVLIKHVKNQKNIVISLVM